MKQIPGSGNFRHCDGGLAAQTTISDFTRKDPTGFEEFKTSQSYWDV